MIQISEELAQGLVNYLQKCPYIEVYKLIGELMKSGLNKNGKKPEEVKGKVTA